MTVSNAMLNIFVRVFRRKLSEGESFDEIAKEYPNLAAEDLVQIRERLENG